MIIGQYELASHLLLSASCACGNGGRRGRRGVEPEITKKTSVLILVLALVHDVIRKKQWQTRACWIDLS